MSTSVVPGSKQARRAQRARFHGIFYEISLQQGDASEAYFNDVLLNAKEKGILPKWLLKWNYHQKWSKEDRKGIDFLIVTDRGYIKINVKSSAVFAKQFELQHRGDGIITVVVNLLEDKKAFYLCFIKRLKEIYQSMKIIG